MTQILPQYFLKLLAMVIQELKEIFQDLNEKNFKHIFSLRFSKTSAKTNVSFLRCKS